MLIRSTLPAFFWTLVIFVLCSMPGKSIPHISWLELLSFDKFVHATIFFVLEILYLRGFFIQSSHPFIQKNFKLLATAICITYGGILEIMQSLVFSERSGDWYDFIANSFGCMTALLLFRVLSKKIKWLSKPLNETHRMI